MHLMLGCAEGANMFKRWMDKNCYCPVGVDPRDLRLVQVFSGVATQDSRGSIIHRPWFPLQKRLAKVPSYQIGLQSHRKVPYRKFGFHKIRWLGYHTYPCSQIQTGESGWSHPPKFAG